MPSNQEMYQAYLQLVTGLRRTCTKMRHTVMRLMTMMIAETLL